MTRLYNWIVTELLRDPDRFVFWMLLAMVGVAVANGWITPINPSHD